MIINKYKMTKIRKTEVSGIIAVIIVKNKKFQRKRNKIKSMKAIKLNRKSTLLKGMIIC